MNSNDTTTTTTDLSNVKPPALPELPGYIASAMRWHKVPQWAQEDVAALLKKSLKCSVSGVSIQAKDAWVLEVESFIGLRCAELRAEGADEETASQKAWAELNSQDGEKLALTAFSRAVGDTYRKWNAEQDELKVGGKENASFRFKTMPFLTALATIRVAEAQKAAQEERKVIVNEAKTGLEGKLHGLSNFFSKEKMDVQSPAPTQQPRQTKDGDRGATKVGNGMARLKRHDAIMGGHIKATSKDVSDGVITKLEFEAISVKSGSNGSAQQPTA